ncbi:MAG: response regulator transcription factor [Chloroflexi bacterium]|nr:response regulator transcription factor [Chloroflexota bacterium]
MRPGRDRAEGRARTAARRRHPHVARPVHERDRAPGAAAVRARASPAGPDAAARCGSPGEHQTSVTAVPQEDAPECPRVLVADDHELVRRGLLALLKRHKQFRIVAEAGTRAEVIAAAARCQPDLVVMDVRFPDGSGIEATREIRAARPAAKVVMLTSYPDEEAVFAAILAGTSGYLLEQIRARDLVAGLEAVGRGELLLDPLASEPVLHRLRRLAAGAALDPLTELTRQEQKILLLIAEGKTNRQIAAEVFLSETTVKNYLSAILANLALQRRARAAAFVVHHRLPGAE